MILDKMLARLIISQMIETIKNKILPPLTPNHIPKPEEIDMITPTIKYGEVRYSSSALFPALQIKGKKEISICNTASHSVIKALTPPNINTTSDILIILAKSLSNVFSFAKVSLYFSCKTR